MFFTNYKFDKNYFLKILNFHISYFPDSKTYLKLKNTTSAGFEPARAKPKRFLVFRLNHSATMSSWSYTIIIVLKLYFIK